MSRCFWMTVLLLASLLFISSGCSKRRKMIEQQQTEIAKCEGEIASVASDEEWRKERETVLESLALEKQPEELRSSVCRNLRDLLKGKYVNLKHAVSEDLLKAVSFDDMDKMYQVFSEEPAVAKWAIADDMKRKVEMDLGVKSFPQLIKQFDEQYPMFRVADLANGVDGDMVRFNKVNGVRRIVSGRLNSVMEKGAKFDATFCPFEDMPDEIVVRIYPETRKRYFRMKAAKIQLEQNLQVSKRLREVLPARFVECGYLLLPECVGEVVDLTSPDNWTSKPALLKLAYKDALGGKMQANNYVFTEVLPENGKEWVPEDVLDKLEDLKKRKQGLEETLENLKQRK